MTHLTGTYLDAIRLRVESLGGCSVKVNSASDGDRLLQLLWSEVMTLDAKYHADIRRRGAADARGDLAACDEIEVELASLSRVCVELIEDVQIVSHFSPVGLSLKAQVLSHLLVQAKEELCDALLGLILAFSEDVSATYRESVSTTGSRSPTTERPTSDGQRLATTVVEALESRQAEMLAHMEEAGDADPVTTEAIGTRFHDSGKHLSFQMTLLAGSDARTKADVVALANVVGLLVQNGVGAEGYGFMLPLCRQLCDVVVAQGGNLPS